MTDMDRAVLGMIGLATKAGKTISGGANCEEAVRKNKACLVLIAGDASPNTADPLTRLCGHNQVPVRVIASRAELGRFTGKDDRAAIAVTGTGFAERILEILDGAG